MTEVGWSLMSVMSVTMRDSGWATALTPSTWLLLVGVAVALSSLWAKQRKNSPISHIPGPHPLAFLRLLLRFVFSEFNALDFFQENAEKYGGIYKFEHGPTTVICVSKPEYLQVFYTSKDNTDRGMYYEGLREGLGDCLFVAGGTKWSKLRELAMSTFFMTPADALVPPMVSEGDWMVNQLREKADGSYFPCEPVMRNALIRTLNISMLGEPITPELLEMFNAIPGWTKLLAQRFYDPRYFLNATFALTPTGRKLKYFRKAFNNYTVKSVIRAYRARLQEFQRKAESIPNLYIYQLLTSQSNFSDEELADEFFFLYVAAFDATSGALSYVLECLGQNPEAQQKVLEEDAAIQEKLRGREIKADDLLEYEYLDRVIKETLRMFPSGPIINRKTKVDTYMGKYLIPKDTNILALQITCNYDDEVFKNANQFDPDRFLPENIVKIPDYALNTFSNGPRGCLGSRYAVMSMKVYLAAIVRNFKILPGYSSLKEARKHSDTEITLKDKNDHPIRLLPRT